MLNEILTADIWRFFAIFARLGSAMMIMPGFGGTLVPSRFRLLLAVAISFLLMPVLGTRIPPLPNHPAALAILVLGEATVGVFLGVVVLSLMTALDVAGTFIGFQTGLTNAFSFDAVAAQQSQLLSSFLGNLALVIILSSDLHHLMLQALVDSYTLFPAGTPLPLGDFSATLARMMSASFSLGVRISAPLLVFGLIFYAGMGLLSRLVPQMQVFFVIMPLQVLTGLWMMMVSLSVMMLLFLNAFGAGLTPYLAPR